MARTTQVKKARKDQGACERCSKPILAGDPYKWVKPKTGPYGGRKRKRCAECPGWKPSELTSSAMATVMAAQEALTHTDDPNTAAEEVRAVAEAAREVSEQYAESAQNIEMGFGHETESSQRLQERADELESWADELDQAAEDAEGAEAECEACDGTGVTDDGQEGPEAECPDCEGTGMAQEARDAIQAAYEVAEEDRGWG